MEQIRKSNSLLLLFFLGVMPSFLKVAYLRYKGHKIGKCVKLGFSFYDIDEIEIGDNAKIASWIYFKGLRKISLGKWSRIGSFCHFTASSQEEQGNAGFGRIAVGEGSCVQKFHYFDIQESIYIGKRTIIAGRKSTFYTHTPTPDDTVALKPIKIGDNCYVGSHCVFLPGAIVDDSCFVGAGAVVTKSFVGSKYVLLAGNPATIKKKFTGTEKFFHRIENEF